MAEVQKTLQRSYGEKRDNEMDNEEIMASATPSFASIFMELKKTLHESLSASANRSQLLSSIEAPSMEKKILHTGTMIFCIDCFHTYAI